MKSTKLVLLLHFLLFCMLPLSFIKAQPVIYVMPEELNYGLVSPGSSTTKILTVFNLGTEDLIVSQIQLSDTVFSAPQNSIIVNIGSSTMVPVTFNPLFAGLFNETITLISNDPANPSTTVILSGEASFAGPEYLWTSILGNEISLSWGVDGIQGNWLRYDNGGLFAVYGFAQAGNYRIASRWNSDDLNLYAGKSITKVGFFPTSIFTKYIIKIWMGSNAETLLYSKQIDRLELMQWNEHKIEADIIIESGQQYWLGLELVQQTESDGCLAVDIGSGQPGYSDMIQSGGSWVSASELVGGTSFNWLIRGFVGQNPMGYTASNAIAEIELPSRPKLLFKENTDQTSSVFYLNNLSNGLGYNVYRDGVRLNQQPLNDGTFSELIQENGIYNYQVTKVFAEGESNALSRTVHLGASELSLNPAFISTEMSAGQSAGFPITLLNEGQSSLVWQAGSLPLWASLSSTQGVIPAGQSATITLFINASGLLNGVYAEAITFNTNNAARITEILRVVFKIDGQSIAVFDTALVDFGMVQLGQTQSRTVSITNLTSALILLFGVSVDNPAYVIAPSTWAVPAGQSIPIDIYFTPQSNGPIDATLTLVCFNYSGNHVLELPLSGMGILLPPSNLSGSIDNSVVTLNWLSPGANPNILRQGAGAPGFSIGTSEGSYIFAHRFSPSDLMPYHGKQLSQIGFFVNDTAAQFSIKIFSGPDAELNLLSIPVPNVVAGQWNDVSLPQALTINAMEYLWIGYEMVQSESRFIAMVDGGPGIVGAGDLFKAGNSAWSTLGEFGLSFNLCIRGILNDSKVLLNPESTYYIPTGYYVYRDGERVTANPVETFSFSEPITAGVSYVYGVSALYSAGESMPVEISLSAPELVNLPAGWQHSSTPIAHQVSIPFNVITYGFSLGYGDLIGVFFHDNGVEHLAGYGRWTGNLLQIVAYGDDPQTPQKEGLLPGEMMHWKHYSANTGIISTLNVQYSTSLPQHDGSFSMMGRSMLFSMDATTLSVPENSSKNIMIYPNPSHNDFFIDKLTIGDLVIIRDLAGRVLKEFTADATKISISGIAKGTLVISIIGQGKTEHHKLIQH